MSPHLPPSLLQMLRPTSPECTDKSTNDRHFVTWTDREDEILRQAVTTYGTDKWSVIAAQFCDKTSRQCRRRWHTYLSADCKKGGWSPEEDQLLLEAHCKFGNRWTEIAKVVPGRTDNAVKNRFCALGKKQAKKIDVLLSQSSVDEGKTTSQRRVLEQNNDITNKRSRGDYGQSLPCHNVLQQKQKQKQCNIQVKKSLQTWTADQSMAHRAHPVHPEKTRKAVPCSTFKSVQPSKTMQSQRVSNYASGLLVNKSTSNEGIGHISLEVSRSFSENVSPPRLAALTQNAALLDSLVERRDARLKLWGSTDDTWKSFDWLTMEGGKILQAASYASGYLPLGDAKDAFYEGKENFINQSQSTYGSQITTFLPMGQEPVNQHKHQHDLGAMTPTVQHERSWKIRSEYEGLDCSSPSNAGSHQAEDSTPLQNDCFSSVQVDQPMPIEDNEVETGVCCDTRCQGLKTDHHGECNGSTALMSSAFRDVSSPIDLTWDSQFLMDDMPSPQFSDSEKQFLLSAFDSSYQHSMLESHLLGSNMSMASFCTS